MIKDSVFIEDVKTNPWNFLSNKEGEAFVKERNRQISSYRDSVYEALEYTYKEDFRKELDKGESVQDKD